jgi:hypothetical protein
LFERENKPFTPKLIERLVGLSQIEALEILDIFTGYRLVETSEIELDDEIQTVYHLRPNHVFLGIIALVDAVLRKPEGSYGYLVDVVSPVSYKDRACQLKMSSPI